MKSMISKLKFKQYKYRNVKIYSKLRRVSYYIWKNKTVKTVVLFVELGTLPLFQQ